MLGRVTIVGCRNNRLLGDTSFNVRLLLEVPTVLDLASSEHSVLSSQGEVPQVSLLLPREPIDAEACSEKCSHASSRRDHDTSMSGRQSDTPMGLMVSLMTCHRVDAFHQQNHYAIIAVLMSA